MACRPSVSSQQTVKVQHRQWKPRQWKHSTPAHRASCIHSDMDVMQMLSGQNTCCRLDLLLALQHLQSQRPKFKISTTSESQKFNIAATMPNKEHACVGSAPVAEMHGLHGQSTGLTSAHQTMAGQRCCHSWSSCHRKAACSPLHLL